MWFAVNVYVCKGKWWLYGKWQNDKFKERRTLWLRALVLKDYCQVLNDISVASDDCINFHGCNIGQFVSENVDFLKCLMNSVCVSPKTDIDGADRD